MIWDLVSDWYRRDRVRVSPATGRLLALQAGNRFIFQNDEFVVQSRHINVTDLGCEITYQLDGSRGPSLLRVVQDSDLTITAAINQDGNNTAVFENEVALLSGSCSA